MIFETYLSFVIESTLDSIILFIIIIYYINLQHIIGNETKISKNKYFFK